jgi:hypothetical protein
VFKIINYKNHYILINCSGAYENHAHVKKESTARMLVKLIRNKRVPDSSYLRESCRRVTIDETYKRKIENKIEKDKQKEKYINVGKGVR